MKRLISILLCLTLVFGLSGCGGGETDNPNIEIKGAFFLDSFDYSKEELDDAQRYFFIVYDVKNDTNENWELDAFSEVPITFDETNTYEQLDWSDGELLKSFLNGCGYYISTEYDTLFGGSDESVRMLAVYAINKNDVKEGAEINVYFDLCEGLSGTKSISYEDIEEITLMDEIFKVEENYEQYQISKSVLSRAELARMGLDSAVTSSKQGDGDSVLVWAVYAETLLAEEAEWGVSVATGTVSDELPRFDLEAVKAVDPEIYDCVKQLKEQLEQFVDLVEIKDLDSANNVLRMARENITEIKEYYSLYSLY